MLGHPNSSPEGISGSDYATQHRDRLQMAYIVVRTNFQHAFRWQKIHYDKNIHGKPLAAGDLVWLHFPVVATGRSKKLNWPWTGPFKVLKRLFEQVHRIQGMLTPNKRLVVQFDRLKPYQTHGLEHSEDRPLEEPPCQVLPNTQASPFWGATTGSGEWVTIWPTTYTKVPIAWTTPSRPSSVMVFITECGMHSARRGAM